MLLWLLLCALHSSKLQTSTLQRWLDRQHAFGETNSRGLLFRRGAPENSERTTVEGRPHPRHRRGPRRCARRRSAHGLRAGQEPARRRDLVPSPTWHTLKAGKMIAGTLWRPQSVRDNGCATVCAHQKGTGSGSGPALGGRGRKLFDTARRQCGVTAGLAPLLRAWCRAERRTAGTNLVC